MTVAHPWLEAVVRHRTPMGVVPTDVEPRLATLPDIHAVIFDVYGTLVISGSGDIGTTENQPAAAGTAQGEGPVTGDVAGNKLSNAADRADRLTDPMAEAMAAIRWQGPGAGIPTAAALRDQIRAMNVAAAATAERRPEVNLFEAWRRTLTAAGLTDLASDTERVVRLAAEYESRANPTWPMPGADEFLKSLHRRGVVMGIVSNAQAFTPPLVEALTGGPLEDSGFDLNLCVYSYRFGQAKPSARLFEVLVRGLAWRGIAPDQALYIGNDMLNDIWAASRAGLRTAWFAGDARSCRRRADDTRCQGLRPDVVMTEWAQISEWIR